MSKAVVNLLGKRGGKHVRTIISNEIKEKLGTKQMNNVQVKGSTALVSLYSKKRHADHIAKESDSWKRGERLKSTRQITLGERI